ncbi:MAG: glutathione S-transferase [Lysobacter sp.]
MIKVHHLNNSRSQRVLWLLEELGLPYEVIRYERDAKTMLAPAALRAVHPLGKSPVIDDGGRVLAESAAILEYLVERYDGKHDFSPPPPSEPDAPERLRYRYWLHYAEGSAMPPLLLSLVFSRLKQAPMPFFAKPIARGIADKAMASFVGPQLKLHLDFMEGELGKSEWFAGDRFTAADIQMSFPVEAAAVRGDFSERPRLRAFLDRIHARPAYQRALEQGGPFTVGR